MRIPLPVMNCLDMEPGYINQIAASDKLLRLKGEQSKGFG